ncbi:MAG: hypothetical protein COA82_03710 [Alkaliphilus sp.]|nr:MAG: hypothetical protein COA82_03710 [Alkaliphilus sp.]
MNKHNLKTSSIQGAFTGTTVEQYKSYLSSIISRGRPQLDRGELNVALAGLADLVGAFSSMINWSKTLVPYSTAAPAFTVLSEYVIPDAYDGYIITSIFYSYGIATNELTQIIVRKNGDSIHNESQPTGFQYLTTPDLTIAVAAGDIISVSTGTMTSTSHRGLDFILTLTPSS